MNDDPDRLSDGARRLAQVLAAGNWKVVFAESCTGGLVAATLAKIPGVSAHHCGSMVTYREATKTQWLGIRPQVFQRHTAVSRIVAEQMAAGVLLATPEADIAAAVTGHLGPDAPPDQDGTIFVGIAKRSTRDGGVQSVVAHRHTLQAADRQQRQTEAAALVFDGLIKAIAEGMP